MPDAPTDSIDIRWHGEALSLLAARAIWWPAQCALLVADMHLGKPAAFRAAGAPVPEAVTDADLARLDALLDRFTPRALLILGDLLHAKSGRTGATLSRIDAWRARRPDLPITLVRGNHDHSAGDPPDDLRICCVDAPHPRGGFALAHEPCEAPENTPTLAGHIHPAISMSSPSGALRAPCFHVGADLLTLPAFGGFTGARLIRPRAGDRVFPIGRGSIAELRLGAPAR